MQAPPAWLTHWTEELDRRHLLPPSPVTLILAATLCMSGVTDAYPTWGHFGSQVAGGVQPVLLAGCFVACLLAFRSTPPRWLVLWRLPIVLVLLLLATMVTIGSGPQIARLPTVETAVSVRYNNDGVLLTAYAARNVLAGRDPYAHGSIARALALDHMLGDKTTPLRRGAFAHQDVYPSRDMLRAVMAREQAVNAPTPEFESQLSYPAGSFLPLAVILWMGISNVLPWFLLMAIVLAMIAAAVTRRTLWIWLAIVMIANTTFVNNTTAGLLDIVYVAPLVLSWLTRDRRWLSATLFGLSLVIKQVPLFALPYYAYWVWRTHGIKEAFWRLGILSAVFVLINLPFIVPNPGAFASGVIAPIHDPMFADGVGLVNLLIAGGSGPSALPQATYTVMEALSFAGCFFVYARYLWRKPAAASIWVVLCYIPLFFAWRSLSSYFYLIPILAWIVIMHVQPKHAPRPPVREQSVVSEVEPVSDLVAG